MVLSATAVTATTDAEPVTLFGKSIEYKWIVAIVLVSALFLDILDVSIVNVALPALGRQFGNDSTEWVVIGYTLSLAVFIPVAGWLSDRIGTKKIFMFAFAVFIGASALCGLAQSIEQLVAFRLLQGVGGGMLTPTGMAMLFRVFPPAERARVSTLIMIPTLAAPALGPALGGVLVTHVGWRWIFYVNLPVGLIALVVGGRLLRESREPTAGRFDAAGFVLSGAGFAALLYALSQGPRVGWTKPEVLIAGLSSIAMLVSLVWIELRIEAPMLKLRLLQNRMFRTANIISVFSTGSFIGLLFVLPSYLQTLRGLSPQESGFTTFPQAFGVGVSTFIVGRLYKRIGPRRLIAGGLFCASITIALFEFLTLDTNLWWIRGLIFVRGMSMEFAFVPMQASSYATIAPADNGRASSIFSTGRQVSISLAVAVLATILASYVTTNNHVVTDRAQALAGFHVVFGVCAGLALSAAIAALFIRDSDAAGTMAPR